MTEHENTARPGPPQVGVPGPRPVPSPGAAHADRPGPPPQVQDARPEPAHGEGRTERTGDEAVDAVLADVEAIPAGAPLADQLARLVDAHGALQRRLTATDG